MNSFKRFKKTLSLLLIIIITMPLLLSCNQKTNNDSNNNTAIIETAEITEKAEKNLQTEESKIEENEKTNIENKKEDKIIITGDLEVHFIDVGQGDCILIKQDEYNMLIDAGDNKYGQTVVNYLKQNGVSTLDYIIGTHPHADHIGGLDDVIYAFNVKKIILPDVIHTTKTFEDVLIAIQDKELKITIPNVGDTYKLGNANFTILAPNSDSYDNLNNYSIVTKLEYGNTSFLFTGDAESTSENEILSNNYNLQSDVLKVGHHGSNTSTTSNFLNAVNPKYAVIQVGTNNKYNHPDNETITKLQQKNIEIYRNDLNGTIIATSNGKNIKFNTKSSSQQVKSPTTYTNNESNTNNENVDEDYIGNINSKIFHKPTCHTLPAEHNRIYFSNKEEAINAGYRPCKNCNP